MQAVASEPRPPALPGPNPGSQRNAFGMHDDGSTHILIVDDENGPRQSLRMLLKEDYEVYLAENIARAEAILASQEVDIIITDIRMPNGTGLDLLKKVKTLYPDIQVILLTGYGELETAMKAIEYGAFAYLEKPFDHEAMLDKVRACVEKYRHEIERKAMECLAMEANRFETLGKIVSGTMHDLGTPLSVLGTHLELIMTNPDKPDLRKRLEIMQSQLQHCNDLVRTTMNFLRQSPQGFGPIGLNSIIETCLDVARPLFARSAVRCHCNLQRNLPSIQGDLVLLRQATLNLIYNACQAMEKHSVQKEIMLETWEENGFVFLAVSDAGPGISEAQRKHIFKSLYSTKGKDGTGLGLTVVQSVTHQHKGEVFIYDSELGGARFVLRFPGNTLH
ncbi:MAG: hybrid sensor histidine kinase/response regulator [Candidatus Hydrogenedentes bacterium]|nr:hybrid sensor histidine kinase/response regulator [Candidatus Hydrogenedentota bacterium]